ncbi:hypothetical protein [Rhodovulum euryhalinum]|uniref:Lipoprotein n=1 Tax=Rhodovulum euryhalinum TaxID=35805 RepID=A0A4R2KWS9_9RHOB|nr:hypothetical protein [Rhodovulum euryhalinum]TCO71155.1 hypothetical protein EV655_10747 [Rhodovulum euryhalinum]
MRRILSVLLLPILLAACAAEPVWAPDEAVARATYRQPGPATITLFTVISNGTNSGGHSALMINANRRVIFDPAGTWWHRAAPERNDVIYGITPQLLEYYIDYHARETYRVVTQTVEVSPDAAQRALRAAEAHGAVPKAMCGQSVSAVLRQAPGFESIPRTVRPKAIMEAFAALPGVRTETIYDDDPDANEAVLEEQRRARVAELAASD